MHTLVEKYINDSADEISNKDFKSLADLGETRFIDRKSIDTLLFNDRKKKNKDNAISLIAKYVSCYSNYEGGILLFGVKDDGTIQDGIAGMLTDNTSILDWLSEVVYGAVTPAVREYSVKYTQVSKGKYLYTIIVAPSTSAPHQAKDGRYYCRCDDRVKTINGIMVQDILCRTKNIDLEPEFDCTPPIGSGTGIFKVFLNNNSNILCEDVCAIVYFDDHIILQGATRQFSRNKGQFQISFIYPELKQVLFDREGLYFTMNSNSFFFSITLVARNMQKREFKYNVKHIGDQLVFYKV